MEFPHTATAFFSTASFQARAAYHASYIMSTIEDFILSLFVEKVLIKVRLTSNSLGTSRSERYSFASCEDILPLRQRIYLTPFEFILICVWKQPGEKI